MIELPKGSEKKLAGQLEFVNEEESKWFVQDIPGKGYVDYRNKKKIHDKARVSLLSAVAKLVPEGTKLNKLRFVIFAID